MSEKIKNFTISFSDKNPVEKSGSFYVDLETGIDENSILKMLGDGNFLSRKPQSEDLQSDDPDHIPNGLAKVFESRLTPREVLKKIESQIENVRLIQLNKPFEIDKSLPSYIKSDYGKELFEKKIQKRLAELAKRKEQDRLKRQQQLKFQRQKEEQERLKAIQIEKQRELEELERLRQIEKQRILQTKLKREQEQRLALKKKQQEEQEVLERLKRENEMREQLRLRVKKKQEIEKRNLSKIENSKKISFDFHQSQTEKDFEGYDKKVASEADIEIKQSVTKVPTSRKRVREEEGKLSYWLKYFFGLSFLNYKRLSSHINTKSFIALPAKRFMYGSFALTLVLFACIFTFYGIQVKTDIEVKGSRAVNYIAQARESAMDKNFASLSENFELASLEFKSIQEQLDQLGGNGLKLFSNIPYLSIIGTGKRLADIGNDLSVSALELSKAAEIASSLEETFSNGLGGGKKISLLDVYQEMSGHVSIAKENLESANEELDKINVADLPLKYRDEFVKVKKITPLFSAVAQTFDDNSKIFLELLGYNGPRKYLFLFQNNHEIRATGGFIGSYGVLHLENGVITKLFIDGIFNPDGQLKENIIPPRPIRKMSAAWSMHDANWFPNFPDSAKKIALFYEKTGGPTVDGVLTMTPDVLIKMLEITGPIRMEDYDVTIDASNFVEATQYEVEVDYDKVENKPKKFISDLAPILFNKLLESADANRIAQIFSLLKESLVQRHVLLYSADEQIQELISAQGWSGEILKTQKDYLMVVNSNINGYKTDGVIDQEIQHQAEIFEDGSVVDTVKIKRKHNGGNTAYEWWNKVDSNYTRVYVPIGSKLLAASGHTREFIKDPIDYEKLGFKPDPDVKKQEDSMEIDEETGTRIYSEGGKTVFANWNYLSPQEEITLEYKYLLPFKVNFSGENQLIGSYSVLFQKQSGDSRSKLKSQVDFSQTTSDLAWSYPDQLTTSGEETLYQGSFLQDQFIAFVLQKMTK